MCHVVVASMGRSRKPPLVSLMQTALSIAVVGRQDAWSQDSGTEIEVNKNSLPELQIAIGKNESGFACVGPLAVPVVHQA
jgi:hypothetical protein